MKKIIKQFFFFIVINFFIRIKERKIYIEIIKIEGNNVTKSNFQTNICCFTNVNIS